MTWLRQLTYKTLCWSNDQTSTNKNFFPLFWQMVLMIQFSETLNPRNIFFNIFPQIPVASFPVSWELGPIFQIFSPVSQVGMETFFMCWFQTLKFQKISQLLIVLGTSHVGTKQAYMENNGNSRLMLTFCLQQ